MKNSLYKKLQLLLSALVLFLATFTFAQAAVFEYGEIAPSTQAADGPLKRYVFNGSVYDNEKTNFVRFVVESEPSKQAIISSIREYLEEEYGWKFTGGEIEKKLEVYLGGGYKDTGFPDSYSSNADEGALDKVESIKLNLYEGSRDGNHIFIARVKGENDFSISVRGSSPDDVVQEIAVELEERLKTFILPREIYALLEYNLADFDKFSKFSEFVDKIIVKLKGYTSNGIARYDVEVFLTHEYAHIYSSNKLYYIVSGDSLNSVATVIASLLQAELKRIYISSQDVLLVLDYDPKDFKSPGRITNSADDEELAQEKLIEALLLLIIAFVMSGEGGDIDLADVLNLL